MVDYAQKPSMYTNHFSLLTPIPGALPYPTLCPSLPYNCTLPVQPLLPSFTNFSFLKFPAHLLQTLSLLHEVVSLL